MSKDDRWKDPKAWECLDDDQREIINDWYMKILDGKEKENKKRSSLEDYATCFLALPITVFSVGGFAGSGMSIYKIILELVSGLLVYGFLLWIGRFSILHFASDGDSEKEIALKSLGVALVLSFAAEVIISLIK